MGPLRNAVATAAKTIRHIDWYEEVQSRGHVSAGEVVRFQVTLKIGFRLEWRARGGRVRHRTRRRACPPSRG